MRSPFSLKKSYSQISWVSLLVNATFLLTLANYNSSMATHRSQQVPRWRLLGLFSFALSILIVVVTDLASGGSDDWAKGVLGVKYSYTVELCDTGRHGFILPPHYITTTGDEMLEAARSLSLSVLRERRRAARKRRRFT